MSAVAFLALATLLSLTISSVADGSTQCYLLAQLLTAIAQRVCLLRWVLWHVGGISVGSQSLFPPSSAQASRMEMPSQP